MAARGCRPTWAVAVNLPAARLGRTEFVEHFLGDLLSAGLDADAVSVEIGENALMEAVDAIAPGIAFLNDRGIRVVAS